MTPSGSGIAHRPRMKEAPHRLSALLGAPQVATQVAHHLSLGARPPATHCIALYILIQELPEDLRDERRAAWELISQITSVPSSLRGVFYGWWLVPLAGFIKG